ncbi:MAG: hypothetical protein HKN08_07025, partial [Gammaproteobacteria bacterium]|nr:hypothetical protein [Gammaproteobacteria bacterium]
MSSSHRPHHLNRRDFLINSTALSVSAGIAGYVPQTLAESVPRRNLDIPGTEELIPENMPKGFSLSEIHRRWNKCREWMVRYDFDALLVPMRPEGNADVKWLTESGPNWVVFPQTGKPTAIYRYGDEDDDIVDFMQGGIEIDIGLLNRSELIITAMKKAGITSGRVGVGNLSGT